MAATRLVRSSRPLGLRLASPSFSSSSSSSSSSSNYNSLNNSTLASTTKIMNLSKGDNRLDVDKKSLVPVKAVVAPERTFVSERETSVGVDLAALLRKVTSILKVATKRRPRQLNAQMFIERAIIDCRFFALFAVAGSLLGSVLCFLEGCFIVVQSYVYYFNAMSQRSDQGHVVQLLIEAIDMFMVGTALLVFGMGIYVMFVGSKHLKGTSPKLPGSNLFGLFHLKTLPRWACMQSVTQAKSKIGHAVIMILQVGVLEKFKNIPLVTGLDLACFAGAVFVSSACVFLLSRLSIGGR